MKHCDKNAVTVNVTNRCNLRCVYCMACAGDEQDKAYSIPLDFALIGIRDALEGIPTGIKAEMLRFFAPGEPTQDMSVIRQCVDYARQVRPGCIVELQTNGLFENDENAKWIAENISVVWFSLDGPASTNDRNRPDAFGKGRTADIERYLGIVQSRTKVGVRVTVTDEFLDNQEALVEYYHRLGVKFLALNPVIRPVKRGEHGLISVNASSQMRFAKGFCRAFKMAEDYGMEFTNSMSFNFDEPTNVSCRSCLPMPQLNPDGSVSSCDMAMYRDTKDELKPFIYGEWDAVKKIIAYDNAKIAHLQSHRLESLPKCSKCPIGKYCAGGCIGRIAYQTGDVNSVLPEICAATIYMAKNIPLGRMKYTQTHP